MEIEVGDYVRTRNGIIFMVDKDKLNLKFNAFQNVGGDRDIIKYSKNIIGLIEDEDIVILEYYVSKCGKRIQRKFEPSNLLNKKIYFDNRHCSFCYDLENKKWIDGKGFNPKIKSIVTHEQFLNIEYIVEE